MSNDHFKGYVAHNKDCIGNLKYESYEPKKWDEGDCEIVRHSLVILHDGCSETDRTKENPLLRNMCQ